MDLIITDTDIKEIIPNVVSEVEGETPLFDKLKPYLAEAIRFLEKNFVPKEYSPDEALCEVARVIVVLKAFKEAVPSLDLVLTPNGFGVVNTSAVAPASRDRIVRLVAELNQRIDGGCIELVAGLVREEGWRDTYVGKWWLSTFIWDLSDVPHYQRDGETLLDTYRRMRSIALHFETELAREEVGTGVLEYLRSRASSADVDERAVTERIRAAELQYIGGRMSDIKSECPDDKHELWHLAAPIISHLKRCPTLVRIWEAEGMADVDGAEVLKNDIKGSYYF